jgi:hypothetical protein
MSHTTSSYYRDRLGFEPDAEPHRQYASSSETRHVSASAVSTTVITGTSSSSLTRKSGTNVATSHRESTSNGSSFAHRESSSSQQHHGHGHYVGTHVGNGKTGESSLTGVVYEENLSKFKGLFQEPRRK